ncbi:Lrp/AsnC family transcriptional regulator [Actinomadura rudentiformis]|uniref:Lrp/AsnC family transcriptional regulator n=1 Tax=Actinomadura rudentiformis TaxID=359158 RepID=A0A6H9Z159_9ACTN|nr:Lrp/AsnC family transcriptional regulator [Actinomadura rudentiformis]KAB2351515.1 Lrp/AsnC family transcriptional regulator [Actinomadura rudentiformis]
MSTFDSSLDTTDLRIVRELTADARISLAELGRRVSLSRPAVAERVRRLEDAGVIIGYTTRLDLNRLGLSLQARVSLRPRHRSVKGAAWLQERLLSIGHVLSCVHVTGQNCYELAIAVRDAGQLEEVIEQLSALGETTTSVVLSEPLHPGDVDVTAWSNHADGR